MRQGPSGRRPRGRPHRKQHGGPPRANNYDSNGPEGRIRGNAHQVYEKYVALARDALSSGDRVSAETFFQHAEHYFRIMNDSTDPRPNGQGQHAHQGRHGGNGRAEAQNASNGGNAPEPEEETGSPQPPLAADRTASGGQPALDEPRSAASDGDGGEPPPDKPRRRRAANRPAEPSRDGEDGPAELDGDTGETASGSEPVSV